MKISILFSLLLISIYSQSQLIKPNAKKWNSKEILKKTNDTTAYFLDYEIVGGKKDIATIKPNEIALITAYFEDETDLPVMFKNYLAHGAISLISKKYAISHYRPKLSKLSNDYFELTKSHSTDFDSLLYVIDGEILLSGVEGKLFGLNFSLIKSIKMLTPEEAENIYGDKAKLGAVLISSFLE